MKKFKPGQAIVFEPYWAPNKVKRAIVHTSTTGVDYPLKYGDVVHFIAEHSPAYGHCIVVDYEGKIITMLHTSDFRAATDEEV